MDNILVTLFFIALSCKPLMSYVNISEWEQRIRLPRQSGGEPCILPPYPEHGQYTVGGKPEAGPGESLDAAQLHVSCHPGFRPKGETIVYCVFGSWSQDLPQCVRFCRLDPHPSVRYRCSVSNDEGYRECKDYEPTGTIVKPQCNHPNYYYTGVKSLMRCTNGRWDHIVICTPDCGRVTPDGKPLLIGGRQARRGEFPWHAGIYLKPQTQGAEYRQICGGSIISTKVIITAAHCFWHHEKVRSSTAIAVAVGKLYRMFNSPLDDDVQKFDVSEIKIPVRYQDIRTNYQDDIAAVTLTADIVYRPHVRPVCVDFDPVFDHIQLKDGNIGKVAGWGYVDKDGTPSQILKVLEMPYVKVEQCIEEAPANFQSFITSDKICAGYQNGSAVCRGDSGGGLVFPALDRGKERYYLRGVVSTAPKSDDECNAYARASFTQILQHSSFIEENTVLYDLTQLTQSSAQNDNNPSCVLPAFPKNGKYEMVGTPNAFPGQVYLSAQLEIRCNPDFVPESQLSPSCSYGRWSGVIPQCVRRCMIPDDSTATYKCYRDSITEEWDCNEFEPSGVKARIICKRGDFTSDEYTNIGVECVDGVWKGSLKCEADCGRGNQTSGMEQPWVAALFKKKDNTFLCGATIVSSKIVITAAHCVWDLANKSAGLPTDYEIAAGIQLPVFYSSSSIHNFRQIREVIKINLPATFAPHLTKTGDIAVVHLRNPFSFEEHVQPVCIDLDSTYLPEELNEAVGKASTWNVVNKQGDIDFDNAILTTINVAHVNWITCLGQLGTAVARYLTTDKLCGRSLGEKTICRGDSGLGFVVPAQVGGYERYFLRGVASTSFGKDCDNLKPEGYTDVVKSKPFLKNSLICKDCQQLVWDSPRYRPIH